MIRLRPSGERGRSRIDWLDSRHTFSFDRYADPRHMGFRHLRVINEDRVQPGAGFPRHPHRDMEILSWVLEGGLEHEDSLGNGSVIRPGELQRMRAGTGILHSEFNASKSDPVHFLQIWILPERKGLKPGYEQRDFPVEERCGRLKRVASREGPVLIHQDSRLYLANLEPGETVQHPAADHFLWIQVARGVVDLNDQSLAQGDGASVEAESSVMISGTEAAELLLFDMG